VAAHARARAGDDDGASALRLAGRDGDGPAQLLVRLTVPRGRRLPVRVGRHAGADLHLGHHGRERPGEVRRGHDGRDVLQLPVHVAGAAGGIRPAVPATARHLQLTQRLSAASLAVWACGVQIHEAVATVGAVATALLVVAQVPWKQWWPIAAWIGWALLVPLLGGHLPTGAGAARLCDWLLWPCAVVALGKLDEAQRARVGI